MARKISRGKKRVTIALAVVLTLAGAGAALAYWTSTGTGAGTATTGAQVAFTITSDPAVGEIAPGSAGETVAFTVTNPGPGTQYLTTVAVALANADGTPWVPTGNCLIADYTATMTTPAPAGELAVLGTSSGVVTVTLANTAANQDDCQGQDVPLYFIAS